MKKVAIIGSGISGLACAVALKEKGVNFTVFEKEKIPGGKLRTIKENGFTLEAGPDSFLPEKRWSVDLIRKVGLEDRMLCSNDEHKGTYIFSQGRLHRLPEGVMLMVPTMIKPLVFSDLISWPGKLRMGMELFIPPKQGGAEESLAQFVTRRLGRECLEKIAEPLVAGIHTSNPDNMSVMAIFPRFVEMEQKYGSLIKGMLQAMKKAPPTDPSAPPMTYFMSLQEGMQQLIKDVPPLSGRTILKQAGKFCVFPVREISMNLFHLTGYSYLTTWSWPSPPLLQRGLSEISTATFPGCLPPSNGHPQRPFLWLSGKNR